MVVHKFRAAWSNRGRLETVLKYRDAEDAVNINWTPKEALAVSSNFQSLEDHLRDPNFALVVSRKILVDSEFPCEKQYDFNTTHDQQSGTYLRLFLFSVSTVPGHEST